MFFHPKCLACVWFVQSLIPIIMIINTFSLLYVQNLYNDCSHIEDVHLLFCANLINVFIFSLRIVEL